MTFKPSVYQQAIFDFITHGKGNAIVMAVAGSGKTTTIVKALEMIPRDKKILFLAFNKSIATELQKRIPSHAIAKTTHALGAGAVRRSNFKVAIDGDKLKEHMGLLRGITPDLHMDSVWRVARTKIHKLVSLAKNHGLAPEAVPEARGLIPDSRESWLYLIEHFDVLGEGELESALRAAKIETDETDFLIHMARQVLTFSVQDNEKIDFDDMLYLPVIFDYRFEKYDWVFVDEAQDIAQIQLEVLKKTLAVGGRLVAVGDPRQAIYGFRGADAEALPNIAKAFEAQTLPLSISYRCPQSVVKHAQQWVSHIEASETAPKGRVELLEGFRAMDFKPGDLVLCRFKAPVLKLAYRLVAEKIPAYIIGRDIGAGIVKLIEKMRAKGLDALPGKILEWHGDAKIKLLRKDADADTSDLDDKKDMLLAIVESTRATSIPGLIAEIESLFVEKNEKAVRLSTIHKAKGLEAHRVFWLEPDWNIKKQTQEWQLLQEDNLRYVAATRAQEFLGLLTLQAIQ